MIPPESSQYKIPKDAELAGWLAGWLAGANEIGHAGHGNGL